MNEVSASSSAIPPGVFDASILGYLPGPLFAPHALPGVSSMEENLKFVHQGKMVSKRISLAHSSIEIADYILYLSGRDRKPITPMQLLKLAYIAHGWMLGLYVRPLTSETAEAWEYGPVLPSIYRAYKRYGGGNIDKIQVSQPLGFDKQESSILDQVWKAYSNYNGVQLSALTHKRDTPWDIARRESCPGAAIPNDLIAEHYRLLSQK